MFSEAVTRTRAVWSGVRFSNATARLIHSMSAGLPDLRFAYRTIRVGTPEHARVLAGESLLAQRPLAKLSVRDHVLRGSGSKWQGSQFISTTSCFSVAVRFAAPCNPIVRIDLARFAALQSCSVLDLSNFEAFSRAVPPADADMRREWEPAEKLRAAEKMGLDFYMWKDEDYFKVPRRGR